MFGQRDTTTKAERDAWRRRAEQQMAEQNGREPAQQNGQTEPSTTPRHRRG
jgi:hypothetical protein